MNIIKACSTKIQQLIITSLVLLLFSGLSLAKEANDIEKEALKKAQAMLTTAQTSLGTITKKQQPLIDDATKATEVATKNSDSAKANLSLATTMKNSENKDSKNNFDMATTNMSLSQEALSASKSWLNSAQQPVNDAKAEVDKAQKLVMSYKEKHKTNDAGEVTDSHDADGHAH